MTELPQPVEAPEPEPVPVEVLNDLRGHLASSGTAILLGELEKLAGLGRARVRQAMRQLLELGLVTKEGRGVGVRYQLVAQASEAKAEESPVPTGRVIRRRVRETTSSVEQTEGSEATTTTS